MRTKIITMVLCLALLCCLPLAPPVRAAAGMTPSQGPVGIEVTISGLTAGQSYLIVWDDEDYKTGTVLSGGNAYFTVSESASGSHTVEVESPTGTQVQVFSFVVVPTIAIDPTTGYVGTSVEVEGTGFAAAEDSIKVIYGDDDKEVKTGITADDNGSWSTTFTVPSSVNGSHVIDASGETTEASDVTDKTFTVSPRIKLDVTSGGVGTSVTVTGSAFDSGESDIEVTYDDDEVRTGIVADVKGSWSTSFQIPSSTKGSHEIDASGETTSKSDIDDITFSVLPGTSIAPTSGYVDDEIEITGSGFADNESGIRVTFDGVAVTEKIVADDEGNWSTSFTVPAADYGEQTIDAYGNTTIAADVLDSTFTVDSRVVIQPKEGSVGETISVTGTGFSSKKDYTITYDGDTVVTGFTTDAKGNFSASFEAPEGKSGNFSVAATDTEGVTASATFSIETDAPEVPRIASPKDGGREGYIGDVKVKFDWTDVSDPSGVHYALEVSEQSNFATTLLTLDNLTVSEYTLSEAEALAHGEYYWRVQAIDGAGNESGWTAPAMVKAGLMTTKSLIIIIVCIIAFIILVSVLPWIIRKIIRMRKGVRDWAKS